MFHVVKQIAAYGRNGDSTLVHMAPSEVSALRTLARSAGTDLTKNPHTGLPEAFNLMSLLPIAAGFIPGVGPMAAMAMGAGIGALANKDDRLMGAISGGMGAYGGSNIAGALSGLGAAGAAAAPVTDLAAAGNVGAAMNGPEMAAGTAAAAAAPPAASSWANMQAGLQSIANDPSKLGQMPLMKMAAPVYGSLAMAPVESSSDEGGSDNGYAPEGETWWDKRTPVGGMPNGIFRSRVKEYADGGLVSLKVPFDGEVTRQGQGPWAGGQPVNSALYNLLSNPAFQAPRPLPPPQYTAPTPVQPALNDYLAPYAAQAAAAPTIQRVDQAPALAALKVPTASYARAPWQYVQESFGGFEGNGAGGIGDAADGTAGVGVGEGGIGSSGAGTAAGDAAGNSEGSGGAADGSGSAGPGWAQGGLMAVGQYLRGPGDGMDDRIPARVNDGSTVNVAANEFVVPADVVSGLGNGSSDAGARVLTQMGARVRKARTGNPAQARRIDPAKVIPA